MFRRPLIASIIVAVASAAVARAQQVPVGDPLEDYFRVLQVAGRAAPSSFVIRPLGLDAAQAALAADSTHPWQERLASLPTAVGLGRARFVLSEPLLRVFENSRFPEGQNDGAVWQGKGLTAALDAGGTLRWGALTVEVRPSLIFTQNGAFTLAPVAQPRREELERVRAAGVSAEELQKAKNQLLVTLYRSLKTIAGTANTLGDYEVFFGDYRKLFAAGPQLEKVTAEEVHNAARRYLDGRNRTVATLVPEKQEVKP